MSDLRAKLLEFHTAMGVPIATVPAVPADDRVRLRARLIVEECLEFLEACFAVDVVDDEINKRFYWAKEESLGVVDNGKVLVDLPEAADALADIAYVVFGAGLEFGVDLNAVLEEVHACNMAKAPKCEPCDGAACIRCGGIGRIVTRREDAKIMKPKTWQPPDVAGVLRRQGWKT